MKVALAGSVVRIGVAVLVVAGGLWLVTFGSFEQEIRYSVAGGDPLPSFRLAALDDDLLLGDTTFIASSELKGRVVLLTFWATWCKPCDAEQPGLLALQEEFVDDGLAVLGVLHKDRTEPALEWLRRKGRLDLTTVVGDQAFARAARVGGLPHTMLVDREGIVTEVFIGYRPERESYLRSAVQALLEDS
jgi:thiol-disulfide isomerase/thioredoxin